MTVGFLDGPVRVDRSQDMCFRVSHDLFLSVLQFSARTMLSAGTARADPVRPVCRGRKFIDLLVTDVAAQTSEWRCRETAKPQLHFNSVCQVTHPLHLAGQFRVKRGQKSTPIDQTEFRGQRGCEELFNLLLCALNMTKRTARDKSFSFTLQNFAGNDSSHCTPHQDAAPAGLNELAPWHTEQEIDKVTIQIRKPVFVAAHKSWRLIRKSFKHCPPCTTIRDCARFGKE